MPIPYTIIAVEDNRLFHPLLRAALESAGTRVRIHLLGDYYPAGDEYDLVHTVTGRLIPPQGIPLQVGAIVANVVVSIAAVFVGMKPANFWTETTLAQILAIVAAAAGVHGTAKSLFAQRAVPTRSGKPLVMSDLQVFPDPSPHA